jgi:hypothetical protein
MVLCTASEMQEIRELHAKRRSMAFAAFLLASD